MVWEIGLSVLLSLLYIIAGYRGFEDLSKLEKNNQLVIIRAGFMESIVHLSIGIPRVTPQENHYGRYYILQIG